MPTSPAAARVKSAPGNDLLGYSALEQAGLIRRGEISSAELTEFYAQRIEALEPQVSAFAHVDLDYALDHARRLDEARAKSGVPEELLFYGVPTAIKDVNLVKGLPARFGSAAFKNFISPMDDVTAAAIRRAGFVLLGKTATSELGAMPVTEPALHPPTRNPWNLGHTSGGSSGGPSAAAAAGELPIAHGNDGAGSIRIPAAFCHLYGIKHSRGVVPNPFKAGDHFEVTANGALGHTVSDVAAFLDVLAAGSEDGTAVAPESFLERSLRKPGRLRVRVALQPPSGTTDPDAAAATLRVAKELERLGHHVEEGAIFQGGLDEYLPCYQRQMIQFPIGDESVLQPITRWLRREGRRYSFGEIKDIHERLQARILAWFGDADLWVTPTVAVPPPKVEAWKDLPPEEGFRAASELGLFTAAFNISGQPAASIPAGISPAGLPIGVQIAAPHGEDGRVLAVSRQLEEALPWRQRHSPLLRH